MKQNIAGLMMDAHEIAKYLNIPINHQWISLTINGFDFALIKCGIQAVRREIENIKVTCYDPEDEKTASDIISACDDLENRVIKRETTFYKKNTLAGDWEPIFFNRNMVSDGKQVQV